MGEARGRWCVWSWLGGRACVQSSVAVRECFEKAARGAGAGGAVCVEWCEG